MRHVRPQSDHIPIVAAVVVVGVLHFPTGCTILFLLLLLLFSPPQSAGNTLYRRQLDCLPSFPPCTPWMDLHIEYDDGIIETRRVTRVK